MRWLLALLAVVFCASGITFVQPGEVAIVLRLGRLAGHQPADQVRQPGLLLAWPYPIDQVIRIPIKREGEVVLEDLWRSLDEAKESDTINPLQEGYLLTGQQNLVQTKVVVKYRIDSPIDFQLRTNDAERVLRGATLSSLLRIVASWSVDDVLRLQRNAGEPERLAGAEHPPVPRPDIDPPNAVEGGGPSPTNSLALLVMEAANKRLQTLRVGLVVSSLEFREMHPPRHVVDEFRQVQSARISMETSRRDAEGFAARQIPAAEAERNRLIQAATAESSSRGARLRAEIAEYQPIEAEYRASPELVRERLRQESIESVLQRAGRVKIVPPGTRPLIADPPNDAKELP